MEEGEEGEGVVEEGEGVVEEGEGEKAGGNEEEAEWRWEKETGGGSKGWEKETEGEEGRGWEGGSLEERKMAKEIRELHGER